MCHYTDFLSGYTDLQSAFPAKVLECSLSSSSLSAFIVFCYFNLTHSDRDKMIKELSHTHMYIYIYNAHINMYSTVRHYIQAYWNGYHGMTKYNKY